MPGFRGLVSRRTFLRLFSLATLISLASLIGIPLSYRRRSRVLLEERIYGGVEYSVKGSLVYLPMPSLDGDTSVERALANRRSIREYTDAPITLHELSQILWAAYGVTETRYGFKTTPSAGATYPLEVYAVIGRNGVATPEGGFMEPGSYKYDPYSHTLRIVKKGDLIRDLYESALEQEWILEAPVNLVFTAVFERTTKRYGKRGERYVWIEVGHASQNVYLQATAMGLATVAIGAFYDDRIKMIIGASENERVLYMMTLARPSKAYELQEESLYIYITNNRESLKAKE